MHKIHIIADSPCDLTLDDAKRYDIELMPVTINWGGRDYRENIDITREEYYKILLEQADTPVTSQITPARFLESYKNAKKAGATHIIVFTISGIASGTIISANVARNMFMTEFGDDMQIEIVDSRSYAMMYGRIIINSAKMRAEGKSYREIMSMVYESAYRAEALFIVYSLRHFKKSGRIGGAQSFLGETLGLKPIARIWGGKIEIIDKARGEKNAASMLGQYLKEFKDPEAPDFFDIVYSDPSQGELGSVVNTVSEVFPGAEIETSKFGCSIVTNTGPAAIAVIYPGKKSI